MFKGICSDEMKKAFGAMHLLKEKRDEGARYNYQNDKRELLWQYAHRFPCKESILVNTKHLERTFKFLKKLLKNQSSGDQMNDLVVNELKPQDLKHTWNS